MSQTNYSRYKYTPDEIDEKEFLAKFVVRNHDFEDIFDDIKNSDYAVPSQHFIIVGQRGQGKTTLLRKIKLAVQDEPTIASFLIPIKFSEEQYQIRSLSRLWEEIADYLQCTAEDDFACIHDDMESHFDDADYELKSFSYLEKAVKAKNKKLLLLIDNIDELLGKLKEKEQRRLREILLTSPTLKIIGGSTKMLEQHFDYGKPFYEFFKIIKLIGLNKQECFDFLASMGDEQQKKKIALIIKNTPERIETLRRLTGGVPRTIVMLFDIFVDDGGNAFDDLLKILDDATPLYKHRMDDLPDTLQDITHTIAMNWDGISTKDIAKKTRLESKTVSAQLKQLETKYGIVESISIGKNKIYKIEERFFNIWYLMRFGRKKDRQKVEWLVNFLTSWCNPADLERRAKNFMTAIRSGTMQESYVYHMCEALSYAGLDINTEHEMKESTKAYLTLKNSSFVNELSASDREIINKAQQLTDANRIDEAIKLLKSSQKNSAVILFFTGYLYQKNEDFKEAEKYYLKAADSGVTKSFIYLGHLYYDQNQLSKAETYYLKAIEDSDTNAPFYLGHLYAKQDQFEKAENYYQLAIKYGDNDAFLDLGALYCQQGLFEKAIDHYQAAYKKGNYSILINLGNVYFEQEQFDKAKSYYLKALENNDNMALLNLGQVYYIQGLFDKAESYYLKAINAGISSAQECLVWLYFEKNHDLNKALQLVKTDYGQDPNFSNTYAYAVILLWTEHLSQSGKLFLQWLDMDGEHSDYDITLYLTLLMAKKQFYKTKELLELPEHALKDKCKPIWYALMTLMQDDFPHELTKMGGELQESVDEILQQVAKFDKKYAIN